MIPTFVFGYPTGQEQGDFLALDLGLDFFLFLSWLGSHLSFSCQVVQISVSVSSPSRETVNSR